MYRQGNHFCVRGEEDASDRQAKFVALQRSSFTGLQSR